VNFEVSVFAFQLVLSLDSVLEKPFYYVDEPININSSIKIQRRSPSGVILSEENLPFSLNGDPLGTSVTIVNVEWKMFSTYSPEDGAPPILNLDYLVDHCNNPPV
jgi:hypothetical protein